MTPNNSYISHSSCGPDNTYLSWDASDYGPVPLLINLTHDTLRNSTFRTTRWTGNHMQLTLMSIPEDRDAGLENHPKCDQFIRVEDGEGIILMGDSPYDLHFKQPVNDTCAVLIPANTWHKLINTGDRPLKLFSIYSPVHHHAGTVHWTKTDSDNDEHS
ncbi:cupin domain-containing protein [Lachnospiraceae bacterium 54-53]